MALHDLQEGRILLVGEGNFSFSKAFVQHLNPHVEVTATSLLCEKELNQLHTSAEENVSFLRENGVKILYEVDATKLQENKYLKDIKYHRIIFNFPHVGGKSNIKKNRALVKDFFASAVTKLADGGDICVTFSRGQGGTPADKPIRQWADSWQSVAMAAYQDLVLTDIWPFDIKNYPQYKSTGFRSMDKQFHTDGAMTYVFCRCLPFLDSVTSDEQSQVSVNGNCYWIGSSYIASHGIRCLCKQKGHPVELVLSHIINTIKLTTDFTVHISSDAPNVVTLRGPVKEGYRLKTVILGSKTPNTEHSSSPAKNTAHNTGVRLNQDSYKIGPNSGLVNASDDPSEDALYLRRSLLDSLVEEVKSDCLLCCYGDVYRRQAVIDCSDLPMKNELLLAIRSDDEGSLSSVKNLLQQVLSELLPTGSQVVITTDSSVKDEWLTSHFSGTQLQSIVISSRSLNHVALLACNQVEDTGKPVIPNLNSSKHAKVSKCAGHIGITQDKKVVALLDLDALCQLRYGIPDAGLLWSGDPAVLDQFKNLGMTDSYTYRPVSLYPPLWRHDVSFWESTKCQFSEEQLMDIIRDVAGDALKCVRLMNVWTEPSTGRISRCYREVYQSYHRAISHDFAHKLQNVVRLTIAQCMEVELR